MTFRKSRNYDVINVLIYSEQEMEKSPSQALKPPVDVGKGPVGLEMTKETLQDSEEQSFCMFGKTLSRQDTGKRKECQPTSVPKSQEW